MQHDITAAILQRAQHLDRNLPGPGLPSDPHPSARPDDCPHAQLTIGCENVEDVIADLRTVRDRIVMGGEKKGLDN
ncbi:hypothetical protein RAD15_05060 [Bradyrhizobium sp. 14AA]